RLVRWPLHAGREAGHHGRERLAVRCELRSFAGLLGASWPAGTGLGLFAAKGLLTLEPRAISFEHANFTLDGNIATGALTLKLGDERPLVEGTLDFETFDVTPYAAPSRPYALALASDWLSTIRIPGLASPSFLRDADADVRISAANVTSGSDRLGRCAASLSVRDGKLYGEIAELELEQGGRGEGQITIDTAGSEPRYTLHAALDDIDLSTVVAPRLGPAAIDGAGDIKLDVNASGASQADILRSLSGKVSLEMVDDGRIGLDIDALPAAAAASTPPSGWGTLGAGSTALSALSASFIAKDGILLTESVAATAGDRGVTAAGSIDIDKSALDLVISVAPASGAAAARPETLGAFRIHGPWSGPTVTRTGPGKAAGTPAIGKDPG
ncbi:MAG: AsmA-like C-terminal region-containing protein, partial [Hyphomicrobium sp.]